MTVAAKVRRVGSMRLRIGCGRGGLVGNLGRGVERFLKMHRGVNGAGLFFVMIEKSMLWLEKEIVAL